MDTLFLLYINPAERAMLTPEQRAEATTEHWRLMDEAVARGKFKGASPLQSAANAFTVRPAGAHVTVTDGPFTETKEVLGGYYIIDCQDDAEAKSWAARLSQCVAGPVEVRRLAALPARSAPNPELAAATCE